MKQRNRHSIILMIVTSLFMAGCSSLQHYGKMERKISVEYVDSTYKVVSRPDLPQKVNVQFTIIPGGIFGRPLTDTQYLDITSIGSELRVSFADLKDKAKSFAVPMLNTEANNALIISPKDTKFARFGTFSFDLETQNPIGGTGFGSPDPDVHALVLTYFDRPAEVKGIQSLHGEVTEFDIKVRNAGLVWLKVEKIDSDHYLISTHESTENEFLFIHPSEPLYEET